MSYINGKKIPLILSKIVESSAGFITGEFVATEENKLGDFEIEHGLGVIPKAIVVYKKDMSTFVPYTFRAAFRVNFGEMYDEEYGNVPEAYKGNIYIDGESTISSRSDGAAGYDTDQVFYAPVTTSNAPYEVGATYCWIAIA